LEDRRNAGENSCNSGDGTDQTGPILDVYDDDDDEYEYMNIFIYSTDMRKEPTVAHGKTRLPICATIASFAYVDCSVSNADCACVRTAV